MIDPETQGAYYQSYLQSNGRHGAEYEMNRRNWLRWARMGDPYPKSPLESLSGMGHRLWGHVDKEGRMCLETETARGKDLMLHNPETIR